MAKDFNFTNRYLPVVPGHERRIMTMPKRDHKFNCSECDANVTCCDCTVYHSVCCMCTWMKKLEDAGQKPIVAHLADRGTYKWAD